MAEAAAPGAPVASGPTNPAGLSRAGALAFVAPSGLLIVVFLAVPAVWTLYLGLTNYALFGPTAAHPAFVGLANYGHALHDPLFFSAIGVTFAYVAGSAVIGQMVLGFLLAWKLRDLPAGVRRLVETVVVLAWITPSAVVAFLWAVFYSPPPEIGTLNAVLGGAHVNWLYSLPIPSLIVFNTWRGTAFSMLLSDAALKTIPPSFLATARLFGASGWQQLRDIILPSIRGVLVTDLLLITLWTFNDFTPYILTGGSMPGATTLPVYVYREAFRFSFFGLGAALSSLMLAINLILGLSYLFLLRSRSR
ncbi:MAG: carbohydrate ABC transporter permease [Chloroflexota bacterium]